MPKRVLWGGILGSFFALFRSRIALGHKKCDFSQMCVFPRREHDFEGQQRLKIDQKRVQEALGEVFFASCFLHRFLVALKSDFGGILPPKMEPSWSQNRTKK